MSDALWEYIYNVHVYVWLLQTYVKMLAERAESLQIVN